MEKKVKSEEGEEKNEEEEKAREEEQVEVGNKEKKKKFLKVRRCHCASGHLQAPSPWRTSLLCCPLEEPLTWCTSQVPP